MQHAVICHKDLCVANKVWVFNSKERAKEFMRQKCMEEAGAYTLKIGYTVEMDIAENGESATVMTVGIGHNEIDEIASYCVCPATSLPMNEYE